MKKETIIALVEKDLRELQVITTGLFELQQPAPSIVKLAQDKANEIAKNMELLLSIPEQFNVKKEVEVSEENTAEQREVVFSDEEIETLLQSDLDSNAPEEEVVLIYEEEPEENENLSQPEDTKVEQESDKTQVEQTQTTPLSTKVDVQYGTKTTIVETMNKVENSSIADRFATKKISDVRRMPIGDRLRFQRELFANEPDVMNTTLAFINSTQSMDECLLHIQENYPQWDMESEVVVEFLTFINRKF
ncbi:MAG: hypothetical protein J6V30_06615 [Paludibacteraceae bacterium]|nr:hypothetical protein [Paludibacteraceae bacterium]